MKRIGVLISMVLFAGFMFYAPTELTRLIMIYGREKGLGYQQIIELVYMWFSFVVGVAITGFLAWRGIKR